MRHARSRDLDAPNFIRGSPRSGDIRHFPGYAPSLAVPDILDRDSASMHGIPPPVRRVYSRWPQEMEPGPRSPRRLSTPPTPQAVDRRRARRPPRRGRARRTRTLPPRPLDPNDRSPFRSSSPDPILHDPLPAYLDPTLPQPHVMTHSAILPVNGRWKACHPGQDVDHNMSGAYEWASSARASLDERARSRRQGRQPRRAGAKRRDATRRRRAHAHAVALTMPPVTTTSCGRPKSSFLRFLGLGNILPAITSRPRLIRPSQASGCWALRDQLPSPIHRTTHYAGPPVVFVHPTKIATHTTAVNAP